MLRSALAALVLFATVQPLLCGTACADPVTERTPCGHEVPREAGDTAPHGDGCERCEGEQALVFVPLDDSGKRAHALVLPAPLSAVAFATAAPTRRALCAPPEPLAAPYAQSNRPLLS